MPIATDEPSRLHAALHNPATNRRVRLLDRLADSAIRIGGIGVMLVVALIFVFLGYEAWPLFRGASHEIIRHEPVPSPMTQ